MRTLPSRAATRSTTIAGWPTSAAVPVRIWGGIVMCRRAMGRAMPNAAIEPTRKTTNWITVAAPASATITPPSAPSANGARKNPPVSISPIAKRAATASHTQALTPLNLFQQGPGEIVGVEGPEVLEGLADPDELDRDAQLA